MGGILLGNASTTTDRPASWAGGRHRRRNLAVIIATWTVLALGIGYGVLRAQLNTNREQTLVTAGVRLGSVKDTLALTFRQLAALPLNLAHRAAIPPFLASHTAESQRAPVAIQDTLDRLLADFALPFALLADRDGNLAVSSRTTPMRANLSPNFASRDYFSQAMTQGASMQFLLGRASLQPGIYFAHRVESEGKAVGVAVVKQDSDVLNRLLNDADGSLIVLTDVNGVVVLGNQPELVMQRLPDSPARSAAQWENTYQREPPVLAWRATRTFQNGRALLFTEIAGMPHLTVSAPLGELPFKAWVFAPMQEEGSITQTVGLGTAAVWLLGCTLIWLSWRRLQSLEAALQARRDLFELAQALPLTVFRYHQPVKGAPSFTFLGDGVEKLFGVDRKTIHDDPALPWRLADGAEQPPIRPQEFLVRPGEDAAWVLADSAARVQADGSTVYNGYWLDVSAQRQAQARFLAVFEHASTGYMFFDTRRGITQCNPATLALFGADDATQLMGRIPWFPGLSADRQADGTSSRERALEAMREHTRSHARVRQHEWRFRRIDGAEFDTDVSVIALDWHGAAQFCAVITDVTARKQLETAMRQAREAAESASQTKSSFLANMSHELRTPMNAIIGMTHLALEDGLPEKQRDYIDKAHGAARNLLQILDDILDLSKIEAGQLEFERIDFALERVIADMADVLGLKADEKGLELLFSAAPGLPERLVGDPTRLRQVLVNLGGNAIKFTERGEVTIGMEVGSEDADGTLLHAWVKDTGVGIEPGDVDRLFQPFTQGDASTTRRYGGTGLGLVISRQLVERMGGTLWVESEPGKGSTFHFSARFGRSTPRAPRAWMAHELSGRRALIVDDNAAALNVLASLLDELGVEVDRAGSGAEALRLVDDAESPYTWFLLDWKMPEMDGIECAREILQRPSAAQPCILLVTAFARDDAHRASSGLPLAGVLNKPVTLSSLHDSLVQAQRPPSSPIPARRTNPVPDPLAQMRQGQMRQSLAGARVLLVEDHPLNQQLACELLRRCDIEVVVAGNGREALDRLDADGPFDGVLMDCQMPVMDGYGATRELRADPRWRELPVIAMTASVLAEDRQRAMASGMNAHIGKPINVETMLRTMAEWIVVKPGRTPAKLTANGAAKLPANPTPSSASKPPPVIDTAAGLARCMGNADLQRRLLDGFRDAEIGFTPKLGQLMQAGDWDRALRRAHDLKGLAGTIGAKPLETMAQSLHRALTAQDAGLATAELGQVDAELRRVLAEIDRLLTAA